MNFSAAELDKVLSSLFEKLPLSEAMPELVPSRRASGTGAEQYEDPRERAYELAAHAAADLNDHPALQAAIWLYVDDLDRSHRISQNLHSQVGSYWHGIMHRREGDFGNSKYWFRQAGTPPFRLDGYDPFRFVDDVQAARGQNPPELVEMQRREWQALFDHCIKEAL